MNITKKSPQDLKVYRKPKKGNQCKTVKAEVTTCHVVLIPESQVQPLQIVSASDYQMHATSPAHLPPSRYLETQMPIMQFWRFQRIQRQTLVFASGIVIWIDIQKNQYNKGTQRSSSWSALKHKSGPKFSIIKKSHECLKPLRDDTRHSNCPKGGGSSLMNRLFLIYK